MLQTGQKWEMNIKTACNGVHISSHPITYYNRFGRQQNRKTLKKSVISPAAGGQKVEVEYVPNFYSRLQIFSPWA